MKKKEEESQRKKKKNKSLMGVGIFIYLEMKELYLLRKKAAKSFLLFLSRKKLQSTNYAIYISKI